MSSFDDLPHQTETDDRHAAAVRHDRFERLRRGSIWFMSVMLLALLIGLMIGRVVNDQIPWGGAMPPLDGDTRAQLLDVSPVLDEHGLTLMLQMDEEVSYQRTEQKGAVSLRLTNLKPAMQTQSGRAQRGGRSLSWRVEAQGHDVQVLLVGLGGRLEVRERLVSLGGRWQLRVNVALPEQD